MQAIGHTVWVMPGGRIPATSTGREPDSTSVDELCVLNAAQESAHLQLTIFYEDQDPVGPYPIVVPPRRVPPPPAYDVVTASQLARGFPPDPHSANRDAAEQHVEALAESLRSRGLRVSTRVEIHQNPAEVILASAADSNVGLIAMASRGRGPAKRLLLGGVTDKVVRGATVPVLVRVPSATRP